MNQGLNKIEDKNFSISINQLAYLKAYLHNIFSLGKQCEKNFNYTKWYFKENYSQKEIMTLFTFLEKKGLTSDCDILLKLDLREFSSGIAN